jgi:hypothetical protein
LKGVNELQNLGRDARRERGGVFDVFGDATSLAVIVRLVRDCALGRIQYSRDVND